MARVTSPFGMRVHPITGEYSGHQGVDFAAPNGSTIYATKPLTVVKTDYQMGDKGTGWGNYALLEDPQTGTRYRYAHLDSNPGLKPGTVLNPGDVIGYVGSSGGSTGNHLHYEVIENGIPKDPKGKESVSSFTKGEGDLYSEIGKVDKNRRPGSKPPAPSGSPAPQKPPEKTPAPDFRQEQLNRLKDMAKKPPSRIPSTMNPLQEIHDGG